MPGDDPKPAAPRAPRVVEFVTIDPATLGGEPVFRGPRVPVRSRFEHLLAGDSIDAFLSDFEGVTREQVLGVVEMAERGLLRDLAA